MGAKVAFTKQKKTVKDGIAMTRGEEKSLELISQRESSLGIFHAVGKVVYNKRDEQPSGDAAEELPLYLSHLSRPKNHKYVSIRSLMKLEQIHTRSFRRCMRTTSYHAKAQDQWIYRHRWIMLMTVLTGFLRAICSAHRRMSSSVAEAASLAENPAVSCSATTR